jgi:putative ABC transport system permease protein
MVGTDLGFNPHNVVVVQMSIPKATEARKRQFFEEVLPRINAMPGIVAAAQTTGLPPYGGMRTEIDVPGKLHAEQWTGLFERCDDGYFKTIGFHLLRGSLISRSDMTNARKVSVVNQTLARKYFGNEDPIGKRIRIVRLAAAPESLSDPSFEIIGVVADIWNQGIQEPSIPEVFIPSTTSSLGFPTILLRTSIDSKTMLNGIRQQIRSLSKNAISRDPRTLDDMLHDFSYARPRFSVLLLSVFGGIGLVLVGSGVYGVIAYSVSRQTREIGIRMALGAERRHVFLGVLDIALRLIGLGVFIGALASFATNRVISSEVWTVAAFDPVVLAGGMIVVVLLGLAACFLPALRATRINPIAALRHE